MKIYTKTGDTGTTSLASGKRVKKTNLRIEAYGTVDELNACIGYALELCRRQEKHLDWLCSVLEALQNELFHVGADLATPNEERWNGIILTGEEEVKSLEKCIDYMQDQLPPLTQFILPGGSSEAAFLHVCRTVCRRAERQVIHLLSEQEINPMVVPFLNRLSDFFFVASRYVQLKLGKSDVTWDKKKRITLCKFDDVEG